MTYRAGLIFNSRLGSSQNSQKSQFCNVFESFHGNVFYVIPNKVTAGNRGILLSISHVQYSIQHSIQMRELGVVYDHVI